MHSDPNLPDLTPPLKPPSAGAPQLAPQLARCSKCVLPETYPGITYDEQGVCNHCRTRRRQRLLGPAALKEMVETHRNEGDKYDCIVALSGGRDSSYLAYYAVKVLGLRPLLYTYDNGEMPQQTWENIHRIADILDLDQVTTASDQVPRHAKHIMSCWVHRPSAAMIGLLCNACRTGFERGVTKTAQEYGIRLILSGSGEPALPFAQGLLITTQRRKRKLLLVLGLAREWVRNPRYVFSPSFVAALGTEFYYRFWHKRPTGTMSIPLFSYIAWNEETIVSTIQEHLGWRKADYTQSTWRSDCKINELKNYLYLRMLGFTKNDDLVSSMIRSGDTSRQAALERLANDNRVSQQFVIEMCKELELDYRQLEHALDRYGVQSVEQATY